ASGDRDALRLAAEAVHDGGHAAGPAQAPRGTRTPLGAGLCGEDDLVGHGATGPFGNLGDRPLSPPRPYPGKPGRALPAPRLHRVQTLSPRKISLTLVSSKTASSASATSGAIDRTVRLSKRFSAGIGSVFVTTTSRIGPFFKRSTAGPDNTACVAAMRI